LNGACPPPKTLISLSPLWSVADIKGFEPGNSRLSIRHLGANQCYNSSCNQYYLVGLIGKMSHSQKLFTLILATSIFFYSCRQGNSPSSSTSLSTSNYLYLTVDQTTPNCPLTLTVIGPTTYQDVAGPNFTYASLVAFNYGAGNYTFYFDGATDGVQHSLSGSETITCAPTAGCGSWSYTVKP